MDPGGCLLNVPDGGQSICGCQLWWCCCILSEAAAAAALLRMARISCLAQTAAQLKKTDASSASPMAVHARM